MAGLASKLTALAGAAVVALSLGACGSAANDPVIGRPPTASLPAAPTSTDQAVSAYELALVNQLNQADQTQGSYEAGQISAEVNALANDHTLILAEQIDKLKSLGASAISRRETELATLSDDVRSNAHLSSSESATLLGLTGGVEAHLQALGSKIEADSLIDVLRADVLSIDASTRVSGLIEPMVHLALGAGDVGAVAGSLAQQEATLAAEARSSRFNAAKESFLLAEISNEVSQLQSVVSAVLAQDLQLTPGGYPGNTATLQTLKNDLLGSESGPAANAEQELAQVATCFADDVATPAVAC
jgi:hypothetical protein